MNCGEGSAFNEMKFKEQFVSWIVTPPWILPTPVRDGAGREWSAASGSLCHGITTELVGNSENPRLYSIRRYSVKQSRGIRLRRIFLLKATLLAATLVPALGLAVYAQQEVDPTWYDP